MPLPVALLARLSKRGIRPEAPKQDPEEEIIAADYGDSDVSAESASTTDNKSSSVDRTDAPSQINNSNNNNKKTNCPNAWNKHHVCGEYCFKRYGSRKRTKLHTEDDDDDGFVDDESDTNDLPVDWERAVDSESGYYYYWNVMTEEVSWLPPTDPLAVITIPAKKLKGRSAQKRWDNKGTAEDSKPPQAIIHDTCWKCGRKIRSSAGICSDCAEGKEPPEYVFEESDDESKTKVKIERPIIKKPKKNKRQDDELDPMDPAAYSEAPRGTWSTGLAMEGEAKTGVDTTASGPLFQQRPYPSPGEILRANKAKQNTE